MESVILVLGVFLVVVGAFWFFRSPNKKEEGIPRKNLNLSSESFHWLVGASEFLADKIFHIGNRSVTLGRGPSNFVQIEDPKVSRKHCKFSTEGDFLILSLIKDSGEILVNGTSVEADMHLNDGDQISMGDSSFYYFVKAPRRIPHINMGLAAKNISEDAMRATMKPCDDISSVIEVALADCNGDFEKAANRLGIDLHTLGELVRTLKESKE